MVGMGLTGRQKMFNFNIELAMDHPEAEQFAAWLKQRGHNAKIGRSTGNYVDGQWTSTDESARTTLDRLWNEYCK